MKTAVTTSSDRGVISNVNLNFGIMIVRFVTLLNISPCQSAEIRRLLERKSRGGNIQWDVWRCRCCAGPAGLHLVEHYSKAVSRCKGEDIILSLVIMIKHIVWGHTNGAKQCWCLVWILCQYAWGLYWEQQTSPLPSPALAQQNSWQSRWRPYKLKAACVCVCATC